MAVLEYTRSPVDSTVKVDMKMYAQALTRPPFECIAFFSSPQKAPCGALHEYCRSSDQDEWARSPRYAHMYSTRTAKVLWHSSASAALPRLGTTIHAAILLPCRGRRHFASLLPASQHERKATLHIRPWHLLHQS